MDNREEFIDLYRAATSASSLKLLYFGGMWCPYSSFTAILKVFYERVRELKGADAIDVIFISSDKTIKDQAKYYDSHHADWLLSLQRKRRKKRLERQI